MSGLRGGAGRRAGLAVAVIAAMALGRAITDLVPVDESASQPFVRTGGIGDTVELRYADVKVSGIRSGPHLYGVEPIAATGQYLIVDLELTATRESTLMIGFELHDSAGRRYAADHRGSACPQNISLPAGLPMYAMFCFDVPKRALEDARLVVSKGEHGANGEGQRRDDLAEIDLGIDGEKAEELWSSTTAYKGYYPELTPLSREPVEEKDPAS